MRELEYRTAAATRGALLFMSAVPGVAVGDRVGVQDHRGTIRNGQVIMSSREQVVVQLFEGTDDLE